MPYASTTDIQHAAGGADRLVQLADWDSDGVADAAVITAVQAEADGWIDGYLRLRYATPIESPTSTLVQLAAAECVYRLRRRRQVSTPEDVQEHEERRVQLVDMGKGVVRPSDPAPAKSDAVRSQVCVNNRDESRETLKGFT